MESFHRYESYSPNDKKLRQLFSAGLLATLVSLLVNYILDVTGVFPIDFGMLYGSLFTSQSDFPTHYNGSWWGGLFVHVFLAVIVFPVTYDFLIQERILPNRPTLKGLLFGSWVWFLIEILVKPFTIHGIFSYHMETPVAFSFGFLISWLVYGFCFERLTSVKMVHRITEEYRRAA